MRALVRIFRSSLLLVWVCLLLGAEASAANLFVIADFDGDGRHDRAELTGREASAVRVWLSTTHSTSVVRGSSPIVGIAALDLDGDKRDELIASGSSTLLQVWTKRRNGFVAFHRQPATADGFTLPSHHSVQDQPADPTMDDAPTGPRPLGFAAAPQLPALSSKSKYVSTRIARRPVSSGAFTPLGPRPPPFSD